MKKELKFFLLFFVAAVLGADLYAALPTAYKDVVVSGAVSIGNGVTAANSKAVLDLVSTNRVLLPPRMTTTQRNAISSTPEGGEVYDLTLHDRYNYNGTSWVQSSVPSTVIGDAGKFLKSGGAVVPNTWATPDATTGGTGFTTWALGDLMYSSATNTLAKLAGNTTSTKKFLNQTGTGSVSVAPAWSALVGADLPNPSASTLGGVESLSVVSHNFLTGISTSGVPTQAQPAFSDISGTASLTSQVTGLLPGANGGSGVNNAGTFTWGSNNITFTTSGSTGLTLPTTGTVDTIAGSNTLTNKTLTSPAINGANFNFGTASNSNRLVLPTDTTTNLAGYTNTAALLAYDSTQASVVFNNGSGWTAVGTGSGGSGLYQNFLTNPGFESGTAGWTASGGTLTTDNSSTGYQGIGLISGTWDSSSAGQTLTGTAYTIGNGLAGTNGLMRCKVMTPTGTATHTFGVWNGTSILYPINVPSSTTAQYIEISFPLGAAGTTVAPRFTSVASNEPLLSIDDCYVGTSFQISTQSPVTDWVSFTPTGSWSTNTTYTGKWRRVGDSAEISVDITLAGAPTSAGLVINMPPGFVIDTAKMAGTSSDTTEVGIAGFSDNLTQAYIGGKVIYGSSTSVNIFSMTTANNGLQATQATPFTFGASDRVTTTWKVPIVGWQSQAAVRADNADFDWTAFTPTGSWSTNTTYTGKYRRIGDTMEVQTRISLAGAPTSAGLTVNVPSGYTIDTAKLVGSGNQQAGEGLINDSGVAFYPVFVFNVNSTAMQVNALNGAGTYVVVTSTNVSQVLPVTFGSGDVIDVTYRVPIVGWTNNQRVPLLVGSVTSNTSGLERIERMTVGTTCSASPCTISNQSGSWVTSVTRASAGNYTINIAAGIFSATPSCTFGMSGIINPTVTINSESATAINILTYAAATAALTDTGFRLICMGQR